MSFLFLRAYWKLLRFELSVVRRDFSALHRTARRYPVARRASSYPIAAICSAVDRACVWYPKRVLCLQRSITSAFLLKDNGISAEVVLGTQQIPFKAHAWVEVNRRVVNDKPYTPEIYKELDRW